jgi:hypothetical protein
MSSLSREELREARLRALDTREVVVIEDDESMSEAEATESEVESESDSEVESESDSEVESESDAESEAEADVDVEAVDAASVATRRSIEVDHVNPVQEYFPRNTFRDCYCSMCSMWGHSSATCMSPEVKRVMNAVVLALGMGVAKANMGHEALDGVAQMFDACTDEVTDYRVWRRAVKAVVAVLANATYRTQLEREMATAERQGWYPTGRAALALRGRVVVALTARHRMKSQVGAMFPAAKTAAAQEEALALGRAWLRHQMTSMPEATRAVNTHGVGSIRVASEPSTTWRAWDMPSYQPARYARVARPAKLALQDVEGFKFLAPECGVCFDDLAPQDALGFACGHGFCAACVERLLETPRAEGVCCPSCRAPAARLCVPADASPTACLVAIRATAAA